MSQDLPLVHHIPPNLAVSFASPDLGMREMKVQQDEDEAGDNSRPVCLGRSPHWPGLTRPRLAGFQVSTEDAEEPGVVHRRPGDCLDPRAEVPQVALGDLISDPGLGSIPVHETWIRFYVHTEDYGDRHRRSCQTACLAAGTVTRTKAATRALI